MLTTGQIARSLSVAPRTVTKWIDKGILEGIKLPLSKDRRVAFSDFQKFVAEHKFKPDYSVLGADAAEMTIRVGSTITIDNKTIKIDEYKNGFFIGINEENGEIVYIS